MRAKKPPRPPTSFKLSDEGKRILLALANKLAIDKTAVLEMSIRELGYRYGIPTEDP